MISAAAEMILVCCGVEDCDDEGVPGVPSALRFRESAPLEIGLISLADNVSVVPYDLKETIYTGLLEDPVIEVIRAG